MFSTIVVGSDGSAQAAEALVLAHSLRDPDQGRLVLTTVFPLYRGFAGPVVPMLYAEWLERGAQETLDRARSHVAAGVPVETRAIAAPSAPGGLNDVAEEVGADLIVLGSSHHGGLARASGRTTVQRLVQGAPCAVAEAAPSQRALSDTPHICVAYDGSAEAEKALEQAYAIAAERSGSVTLLGAIEPIVELTEFGGSFIDPGVDRDREAAATASLEQAAGRAPAGVDVTTRFAWGDAPHTLLEMAAGADLVVSGSRGYGPVRRALAGSVSMALLTHATAPVLVVPR
jgi:nucleotide-binding universal stress UspA family protein